MRRFTLAAAGVMTVAGLTGLQQVTAHAANLPATCATLQTELNLASAGDTVTLTNGGIPCTAPVITYPVTLPTAGVTLTGALPGDGFNGQGAAQLLTGNGIGATTISNLVFENGHDTVFQAAAIDLNGNSTLTISGCAFRANSGNGYGAVRLDVSGAATITNDTFGGATAGDGNTSSSSNAAGLDLSAGGDVQISNSTFTDNTKTGAIFGNPGAALFVFTLNHAITFSNNTVTGNRQTSAGGDGGGAALLGHTMTITGNTFDSNSLPSGTANGVGNLGGGLLLDSLGSAGATVTQAHNLFENNQVGGYADTNANSEEYFGGGGEYAQVSSISSFDDTFTGNTVGAGSANSTGAGGGFGVQGIYGTKTTLMATNLVATNNSVQTAADGDADGGGIYAGFTVGCPAGSSCAAEVDLFDSTVTANSAFSGPGLSGGAVADVGHVTNSIVYGNSGSPAQLNFTSPVVTYSDSCSAAATAYTGTGNICVDPALANPTGNDVHETATSPTVNAGNNALIPTGVTTDYVGNARIIGGTVDMGAAEYQAPTTATPTPVIVPPVPAAGAVLTTVPAGVGLAGLGVVAIGLLGFGALVRRRTRPIP